MKLLSRILFVILMAVAGVAAAQPPTPASVAAKLQELYPQRQFGPVATTPIPGLYEVVTGDSLSYVDASGKYLILGGQLLDFGKGINLSEARINELNKLDPSKLNLADAIKMVKGNGKRILYVFADPNCAFCKKLESTDLNGVDNVTVYTFLYPILQGSKEKAAHIWCAPDRAKTWDDWMIRGTAPMPFNCDTPLERNLALGRQHRITGTPTMFSADGRRLAGAAGTQAINAFLDQTAQVAAK